MHVCVYITYVYIHLFVPNSHINQFVEGIHDLDFSSRVQRGWLKIIFDNGNKTITFGGKNLCLSTIKFGFYNLIIQAISVCWSEPKCVAVSSLLNQVKAYLPQEIHEKTESSVCRCKTGKRRVAEIHEHYMKTLSDESRQPTDQYQLLTHSLGLHKWRVKTTETELTLCHSSHSLSLQLSWHWSDVDEK